MSFLDKASNVSQIACTMRRPPARWTCYVLVGLAVASAVVNRGATAASARLSSTMNASPPAGAIVLFDGSDLDAWVSQKDRHWEQSDGPADWKILPDGSLEAVPGAGSLITKQRFGDVRLHLEFRLLDRPTNGGVFLMARYELGIQQMAHGDRPQAGAFENLREPIRPRVPAALPALQWQKFDVDFRAPRLDENGNTAKPARATVWLNGVLIHDEVQLGPRKGAAKRLDDSATGPLMLQEHGTAYQFRNVWIVDESSKPGSDPIGTMATCPAIQ